MNCLENESVCSVKKENNKGYYRLHTIWKANSFIINIMSKDGAWSGEMSQSDIEKISSLLEMDASTYLIECKKALTTHDGLDGMSYTIENGCFEWKKIIDEDQGVKRKMGVINVQPSDFIDNIQNFVTAALKCNKHLEAELKKNQEILQKNCEEKQELLNKLDEFINIKNNMENELYSKFILLLNTKKNKIKELKYHLNNYKHKNVERAEVNLNVPNPYEMDTDSEEDCTKDVEGKQTVSSKKLEKTFKSEKLKTKNKKEENTVEKKEMASSPNQRTTNLKIKSDSMNYPNEILSNNTASTYDVDEEAGIPSTQEDILNYFYGS